MATGTQTLLYARYPNILWGSGGITTNPSVFSPWRQKSQGYEIWNPSVVNVHQPLLLEE